MELSDVVRASKGVLPVLGHDWYRLARAHVEQMNGTERARGPYDKGPTHPEPALPERLAGIDHDGDRQQFRPLRAAMTGLALELLTYGAAAMPLFYGKKGWLFASVPAAAVVRCGVHYVLDGLHQHGTRAKE